MLATIALSAALSSCGAPSSKALVEPPGVVVSTMPLDAAGDHELILAVHRDKKRFCYYYGSPGAMRLGTPVIHVRRGERFALRIVNDIASPSKGENVASNALKPCSPATAMAMPMGPTAHYVGYLNHPMDAPPLMLSPLDTNIHLHGFQGPADQENIFLSTLSTPMHACEYSITIPATQPPGTYFYHPHAHGGAEAQVSTGLDGAWIVDADVPQLDASADHVVLLNYLQPFASDNAFAPDDTAIFLASAPHLAALKPAPPVAYDPFAPPPWPLSFPMRTGSIVEDPTGCDARQGETVVSVDGTRAPATLTVPAAQTQLLRIVNGTSDSPKVLRLHDDRQNTVQMRVVARDGVPVSGDAAAPLSHYVPMDHVTVPPAGRVDVLVDVAPGQTLTLAATHFCEGADAFYQLPLDLLHVAASSGPTVEKKLATTPVDAAKTPAAELIAYARTHRASIRRRAITFTEYVVPTVGKSQIHPVYFVTDTTNPKFHEHPFVPVYAPGGKVPLNADVVVKAGTVEEWTLINTTLEQHAFHIHQMAFVYEAGANGYPLTVDTVILPVGTLLPNKADPNYPLVKPSLTKVLLDFRHVPRGTFVFHCHMLFHEDHGMMAIVRVE